MSLRTRAAIVAVSLSILFLVVYCTTNWIASLWTDLPQWYFEWELSIPLVPIMILPYMSIDLFFVAAPFLCRNREELQTFSRRVILSVLVAGLCFLLFPLKLAFTREPVEGLFGPLFNMFLAMDQPHNLLPSLHITLRTILADLYGRHTLGLSRYVVHVWFCLIGISTLLTHQHQVVDILGGFALATLAMYLFREKTERQRVNPNRRIGGYYALLALCSLVVCVITWRMGVVMLWPAVATGIVAGAYFGRGPDIYRKQAGRLPFATRLVLGPILIGQYLSLLYYRRTCRPWGAVTDRLLIGRQLNDSLAAQAVGEGVVAVLDLTAEFTEAQPFLDVTYFNLPILDLTSPTPSQLDEAVAFIQEQVARGKVYVHCKIGYSRSAAVVGAYLIASGQAQNADEAMSRLRTVRPSIVIRPEAEQAIRQFVVA